MTIEITDFELSKQKGMMIRLITQKYDRSISSFITQDELNNAKNVKEYIAEKVKSLELELIKHLSGNNSVNDESIKD
jgi:poly(3-hydroxyalkanoate) synthetase